MDNELLTQLSELAVACNKGGISPIICGGLGVYLSFCKKESEVAQMIRATQDIDLMLSPRDLIEEAKRRAIAKIITDELKYVVRDDMRHHGFVKEPNRQLDVLAPPVEGLKIDNYRVKVVRDSFSEVEQKGWQAVLESSNFYPNLDRQEKEDKLVQARSRLTRWF